MPLLFQVPLFLSSVLPFQTHFPKFHFLLLSVTLLPSATLILSQSVTLLPSAALIPPLILLQSGILPLSEIPELLKSFPPPLLYSIPLQLLLYSIPLQLLLYLVPLQPGESLLPLMYQES